MEEADIYIVVARQKALADELARLKTNISKDGPARKTVKYKAERLQKVEEIWREFASNHNKIKPYVKLDTPYISGKLPERAHNLYCELKAVLEAIQSEETLEEAFGAPAVPDIDKGADVYSKGAPSTDQEATKPELTTKPDVAPRQLLQNGSDISGLIRRQQAAIDGLYRAIPHELADKPREFYQLKIRTIERRLEDIQQIHNQIHEQSTDPEANGYNAHQFYDLEEAAQESLIALYQLLNQQEHSNNRISSGNQPSSLNLPNIVLPKFDGDYMKWRQFHDLFAEMVHRKPMANCQKMYYLKTSLVGEAEKLIRHIVPTEENYEAAWNIINERFENKRLLVTAVLNKLMGQTSIPTDSAAAIKSIHDTTQECLLALKGFGIDTSTWDPMLLHVLIKKLDVNTHTLWEQSIKQPKLLQSLTDFLKFLETRFQSLEALGTKTHNRTYSEELKRPRKIALSATNDDKCVICNQESHPLFKCPKFNCMTTRDRITQIKAFKRCFNCLRSGHQTTDCKSGHCTKCNKYHHTLLHISSEDKKQQCSTIASRSILSSAVKMTAKPNENAPMPPNNATLAAFNSPQEAYVFLSTVNVQLMTQNGTSINCRAILDSGSQVNLITEKMIRKLRLPLTYHPMRVQGIGEIKRESHRRANISIKSNVTNFNTRLEAIVLRQIVSPQPSQTFDISKWKIPGNIQLADPLFNTPRPVDLLIGAEFFHQLLCVGQIKLGEQLPLLQNTLLGWVVTGKMCGEPSSSTNICGVYAEEKALEKAISKFWETEDVSSSTSNRTLAEDKCEELFNQTITRDSKGRFVARLPFSDGPEKLGCSSDIALSRFYAIERKLTRNPELKSEYSSFMNEYLDLGHMKEINYKTIKKPHYFLPHHCVLKPESSTTKLRVVFDASAKTSSNISLNDILYTGPKIQDDLFTILLRFRLPKYVMKADIQKMYRQIRITEEDQTFQLIWWRSDPTKPLKCYKLSTVTYGTTSAPYLATKCLQLLAKEYESKYPLGSQVLQRDFYVDDAMTGADSLIEAKIIQKQLSSLLWEGGFQLRKWCSNNENLLSNVPLEDQEVPLTEDDDEGTVKTLGLIWRPKSDVFCIKTNCSTSTKFTKRSVASDIARLFDPLGIVAPVVIVAKLFLQELWELKYDWDAALPEEMYTRWKRFYQGLQELDKFTISRHVFGNNIPSSIQLHTFADASERAYGAAVYLRSINKNGTVIVRLLCSKSRVAPTTKTASGAKAMTIPRLELCAALLAAELSNRVKRDLKLKDVSRFLWTDSQIVVSWINSNAESFQSFVGRRIASILKLTDPIQWRHVSSSDNPADVLSRGISPEKLQDHLLWKYGPKFLHGTEALWPPPYKKVVALAACNHSTDIFEEMRHSNSFRKMQRITAYCLRFIQSIKNRKIKDTKQALKQGKRKPIKRVWPASTQELENAMQLMLKNIQSQEFITDIRALKDQKELHKKSALIGLAVFLDEVGLLRVGGRLQASDLPYDTKHPILLPHTHPFTKMIMTDLHIENNHIGPQGLLAITRQKFWPIKGKNIARSIAQHCVTCTKAKPTMYSQMMGNLPAHRVQPARPFINSGVDFCGPLWVHYRTRGSRPQKCYLSIFCCFATKAVHIEVVSELTTEAFIGALKRFMSRRGHVRNLYCDNATNFVGARNQLEELKTNIYSEDAQHQITANCSSKGIDFHFIPPRAPHFGGLWEAAVKSAKHLLLCKVSTASLTYEELCTVTAEVEAILNSRPLTAMSDNPNDLSVLTPGHFLIGEPLKAVVDQHAEPQRGNLATRWKLVSTIKKEFWNRWSKEYLNELQQRTKWKTQSKNVQPGTVVIIKEENTPVMKWPLGRIEKVIVGNDGHVRVAEVRTKSGVLCRPIHKLAPLVADNETSLGTKTNASSPNRKRKLTDQEDNDEPSSSSKSSKQATRCSPRSGLRTLLLLALLLPIVAASDVEVINLNNSAPGIHFQKQGTISLVHSKWNLIVYYNLAAYHKEFQMLENSTKALEHLCNQMSFKGSCRQIIQQIDITKHDVIEEDALLSTEQIKRRLKRGAMDVVGNIASALFGVLDSKYADEVSHRLEEIHSNEEHLIKLSKNHTSILDSTVNIMKRSQEDISKRHQILEVQFKQIVNRINNFTDDLYQSKVRELFTSWSIYTTLVIMNIQRTQTAITDVLADSHQGRINHLLISPQQLNHEVAKIKNHLPPGLRFPVEPDDMLNLYKLMSIEGQLTTNYILFKIELPLIKVNEFTMFKIIPIPAVVNETLIAIQPSIKFLAVSSHHDEYYPVSEGELTSCTVMNGEHYLCTQAHPVYRSGANLSICEINLLNNIPNLSICQLKIIQAESVWTKLPELNQWIFAVKDETTLNVVCDHQTTFITIHGSGYLKMQSYCVAKHRHLTLQGQQIHSKNIRASYTRQGDAITAESINRLSPLQYYEQNISLFNNDLQELQRQIKSQQLELPSQIHYHNVPHTIMSSLGLLITSTLIIYLAIRFCITRYNQRSPPTPAPRSEPISSCDFQV